MRGLSEPTAPGVKAAAAGARKLTAGRRGRILSDHRRGASRVTAMTSEHESPFYPRIFALVAAAILAVAVWKILQPFIAAILWSILLAFLLYPLNRRFRVTLGDRRAIAALVLTFGFVVLL